MNTPSWMLPLFDGEEVTVLAEGRLHRWQDWVLPIHPKEQIGNDIAYEDDFESIKTEISKLSGSNSVLITTAAERLLKTSTKDLRVAAYYTYGNLCQHGLSGFSDGLELICSLLQTYHQNIWPKRPMQRRNALEWLASEKVTDTIASTNSSHHLSLKQTLSALVLLQNLLSEWEEEFRPNLLPLFQQLEQVLNELSYKIPEKASETITTASLSQPIGTTQIPVPLVSVSSISSSKTLLDQTRLISAYLRQQENGYWAAYKMIRAIRWGTIHSLPPVFDGQTRLKPPRIDLQTTLKRLVAEKQWLDLLNQVEAAFLEAANQYWLDLQYYAWLGQKSQGGLYADQADSALSELKILLIRYPELLSLNFEGGNPFVSDFVAEWIQNQVLVRASDQEKTVIRLSLDEDSSTTTESAIRQEALHLLEEKGLESAITWLDTHPHLQSGKSACYKFLLMAKLADLQQKNDWAVYLLEQSINTMQSCSIIEWDRNFSFEIYAMLYRLVCAQSKRKDMQLDVVQNQLQVEHLKNKLMRIDAVRALYLFH